MSQLIEAVYHGTNAVFDTFDQTMCKSGIVFFSTEKGFAIEWAIDHAKGCRPVIVTVTLNLANPWDYQNELHVFLLLEAMQKKGIQTFDEILFEEGMLEGNWMAIERTDGLVQCIRELGHDAFYVTEGSDCDRNIAVFDAASISIVGRELVDNKYLAGVVIDENTLGPN